MRNDKWQQQMTWNIKAFVFLIFVFVLMAILQGCSHKTVSVVMRDTLTVVQIDTVLKDSVRIEKTKEYVDRWRDRLIVKNEAGDTVKDHQVTYIYVDKESELTELVSMYKSRCDSLQRVVSREREAKTSKPPSIWDTLRNWLLVLAVAGFAYFLIRIYRKS
ncbi:MAG: hypothetical protein IKQ47_07620 [Prevotella sp.]|nr:hypothetical protein [Prevotella sp.]